MIPDYEPGCEPDVIIFQEGWYFHKGDRKIYYLGYGIVAVTTKPDPNKIAEFIGDDSLLLTCPQTIEEAVDDFITFFSSSKDWDKYMSVSENQFISSAHFYSGEFIRNNYFLWWFEGHGYKKWPVSIPPLVSEFNKLGITHADDMSSIILKTAYRKANNLPVSQNEMIEQCKAHWKREGFADGIYKRIV